MGKISLRFGSFKLHLTIPPNQRFRLPETMTLIYFPRINANPLEINGIKILHNKPTSITLHRHRSTEAQGECEVIFTSKDRVFTNNGLAFQIYNGKAKVLRGNLWQCGRRWGLECEAIGLSAWAEVSVVTNGGVLMRERVKQRRNRFCPKLPVISEEDEEDMGGSYSQVCPKKQPKVGDDKVAKKGISWANVGIWVACMLDCLC